MVPNTVSACSNITNIVLTVTTISKLKVSLISSQVWLNRQLTLRSLIRPPPSKHFKKKSRQWQKRAHHANAIIIIKVIAGLTVGLGIKTTPTLPVTIKRLFMRGL